MSNLSHHPAVPENCPGMNCSEERWFFEVSWADEELPLDEAHLYQDVYVIIGSICFWWATRRGEHELAQAWADWMEECDADEEEDPDSDFFD